MTKPATFRRMIENEVVFREQNEKVSDGLKNLKKLAKSENLTELTEGLDTPLQFYCECSDENCLKPSVYSKIHAKRNVFIVLPGHDVASIETIVAKEPGYLIVEKNTNAPETATKLKSTPVDNA